MSVGVRNKEAVLVYGCAFCLQPVEHGLPGMVRAGQFDKAPWGDAKQARLGVRK